MIRVPNFIQTDLVNETLQGLPEGIREKLGEVDFWFEIDPVYAGVTSFSNAVDGRSYRNTSHVNYEYHAADKRTTVALLDGDEADKLVILHELGHVLDERIKWDRPDFTPLDSYAATNDHEAFATAFQSYFTTTGPNQHYFHTREQVKATCPLAAVFFESIS